MPIGVFLYDSLLSLVREIDLIWTRSLRWITLMYFITRHMMLVSLVVDVAYGSSVQSQVCYRSTYGFQELIVIDSEFEPFVWRKMLKQKPGVQARWHVSQGHARFSLMVAHWVWTNFTISPSLTHATTTHFTVLLVVCSWAMYDRSKVLLSICSGIAIILLGINIVGIYLLITNSVC